MPAQDEARGGRGFRSLTVTLAAALLALSTVVMLIATGLQLYFNTQTQQQLITSQQQLIAQDAASTVRNFIQDKFSIMQSTAIIGSLAAALPNQQKGVLDKLLGREPSFRQVILLDAQDRKITEASRLSQSASGLEGRLGSNLSARLRKAGEYISSVYIDPVTSEPMVIMAVPVSDVFGDMKGALATEVNLKFMWDLVGAIRVGSTGDAYVVDRQGNLIAFADISRVLKRESLAYLPVVNKFVNGNASAPIGGADVVDGIRGTRVVANYVRLGTPDWAVVVEVPVEEAYQPVFQVLLASVLIVLMGVSVAVVAGVYISRRITTPIKRLRDAAIRIGRGELDAPIEVKSRDEVGELASAFGGMMRDLKDSREKIEGHARDLERKVEERTRDLQAKVGELERFNRLAVGRELRMIELKKRIRELEERGEREGR
jgi:methyl-accepting chemotaxis protein